MLTRVLSQGLAGHEQPCARAGPHQPLVVLAFRGGLPSLLPILVGLLETVRLSFASVAYL